MSKKTNATQTEANEQKRVVYWATMQSGRHPELALLVHVPNEGKRSPRVGAELKAMGLKAGFPDLLFPVPRGKYHGMVIEMKCEDGKPSDVSQAQKWWLSKLRDQGYATAVCFGSEDAIRLIERYLALNAETVEVNIYDEEIIHPNCTVQILRNSRTGEESVGWWRNDDGEADE